MKMIHTERAAEIILSRRNVLALLHKLDMKGSARTLEKYTGEYPDIKFLRIRVEDDAKHYGDVTPGVMHQETEEFIERDRHDPARC